MKHLLNITQTIFIIWIWGVLMIAVNPYNWDMLNNWYHEDEVFMEQLAVDCISDYTLDWEDPRCDRFRPEGDQELIGE